MEIVKKNMFEHIQSLQGKEININAEEFMLLILGVTSKFNAEDYIDTEQQVKTMNIVGSVIDFLVAEEEDAKKVIELTREGIEHTQKIANLIKGNKHRGTLRELLIELLKD